MMIIPTCFKRRFNVSSEKCFLIQQTHSKKTAISRQTEMRWRELYLESVVYKAERPSPICGCSRELSDHAGIHCHLRQFQAVFLQVIFNEHTLVSLQHLQGHLAHLSHQVLVVSGPFLKWEIRMILDIRCSLAFLGKCLFCLFFKHSNSKRSSIFTGVQGVHFWGRSLIWIIVTVECVK